MQELPIAISQFLDIAEAIPEERLEHGPVRKVKDPDRVPGKPLSWEVRRLFWTVYDLETGTGVADGIPEEQKRALLKVLKALLVFEVKKRYDLFDLDDDPVILASYDWEIEVFAEQRERRVSSSSIVFLGTDRRIMPN